MTEPQHSNKLLDGDGERKGTSSNSLFQSLSLAKKATFNFAAEFWGMPPNSALRGPGLTEHTKIFRKSSAYLLCLRSCLTYNSGN